MTRRLQEGRQPCEATLDEVLIARRVGDEYVAVIQATARFSDRNPKSRSDEVDCSFWGEHFQSTSFKDVDRVVLAEAHGAGARVEFHTAMKAGPMVYVDLSHRASTTCSLMRRNGEVAALRPRRAHANDLDRRRREHRVPAS